MIAEIPGTRMGVHRREHLRRLETLNFSRAPIGHESCNGHDSCSPDAENPQDPDVIMVGEIRDAETAHIAIHAALTGHLVKPLAFR